MVDDQIGHDGRPRRERLDVGPGAETRIDLRVVDRIEARVGAVDRMEEGQQVNAGERVLERTVEEWQQVAETSHR